MKNKIYTSVVCAATMALMLTACGTGSSDASSEAVATVTAESIVTESTVAETASADGAVTVNPYPTGDLSIDGSMDDVTFQASFTPADVTKDGDTYSISFTGYSMIVYDNAEIESLKEGDTLVVNGADMVINTITVANNYCTINGGETEGGVDLVCEDDMFYHVINMDGSATYESLGEATLPVSADCVISDYSEDPSTAKTLTVEELTTDEGTFDEFNTSFVVSGGEITEITRSFRP